MTVILAPMLFFLLYIYYKYFVFHVRYIMLCPIFAGISSHYLMSCTSLLLAEQFGLVLIYAIILHLDILRVKTGFQGRIILPISFSSGFTCHKGQK